MLQIFNGLSQTINLWQKILYLDMLSLKLRFLRVSDFLNRQILGVKVFKHLILVRDILIEKLIFFNKVWIFWDYFQVHSVHVKEKLGSQNSCLLFALSQLFFQDLIFMLELFDLIYFWLELGYC